MIDLSFLKNRWQLEGAREIFEELVLHCVRTIETTARRLRPNPGDAGIDTFVGEFTDSIKVWQAKYFLDEIGTVQQNQVNNSWNQLQKEKDINKVTDWTLCIPGIMDLKGEKWWQGWKSRKEKAFPKCKVNLWYHSDFVAFSVDSRLKPIFDCALERGFTHSSRADLLAALSGLRPEMKLHDLPAASHLASAQFVKKLELAGVTEHRSARASFYNFELLRASITQGGSREDIEELKDLLLRVHSLWETEFQARVDDNHARQFYAQVLKRIGEEQHRELATNLPAGLVHKIGSVHYWADLCDAGWTDNFTQISKLTGPSQT